MTFSPCRHVKNDVCSAIGFYQGSGKTTCVGWSRDITHNGDVLLLLLSLSSCIVTSTTTTTVFFFLFLRDDDMVKDRRIFIIVVESGVFRESVEN